MMITEMPKRTDAETNFIIEHIKWRHEFENHLGYLAHMCDQEITNVAIVWTHSADDLDADYKAARKVRIYRGKGNDNSQSINTNCDSPLAIVRDIWRYIE